MTYRVDRFPTSQGLVLHISGRITRDDLDILRTALEDGSVVAVELAELELIDRDALKPHLRDASARDAIYAF